MKLKNIIMELSNTAGPSGFENEASRHIAELLVPYVDEIKSDAMGNLIAIRRCGIENADTLMLNAHMDEIGFITTGYDKGFLQFSNIGGIDPRMLPALEVKILTDPPIYGVIDTLPPHVLDSSDMNSTIEAKKLYIDIGMTDEMAKQKVPLGTPIVFATTSFELGEDSICGKSLDDRACVAIIIKTMEKLAAEEELTCDVVCLISTQEELGYRGAIVGAFSVAPKYSITLDVTHGNTPDAKKRDTLEVGGGTAIGVGPNMNKAFTEHIINCAKKAEIKHQIEVIAGQSGTDTWAIQVSREGIATALLSVPVKYMHTPVETMNIEDCKATVNILVSSIKAMGGNEND